MNVVHKAAGYDKRSETLEMKFPVPDNRLDEIRELARIPTIQEETFGLFSLDRQTAWTIAWRLHLPMNVDHYDWFFEPFAEEAISSSTETKGEGRPPFTPGS